MQLSQSNQEPLAGWLLLSPRTDQEDRPETVVELLNAPRVVLPFVQDTSRTILLLTRSNIDWVAVEVAVAPELVLPPDRSATRERHVELRLADESRIDGIVRLDASRCNLRQPDFLNGCDDFFALKTDFGTLIVNRRRIREARPIDPASRSVEHDTLRA